MNRHALTICLIMAAGAAQADEIGIVSGPGFEYSDSDEAVLLGYRRFADPLPGCDSYYEFIVGGWNGSDRAAIVSVTRGLSLTLPDQGRFTVSLGAGYLDRTTENLGTHVQFILYLGYEHDVGEYILGVGAFHVSNGKKVFHWEGANKGENYVAVRLARRF